MAGMHPHGIRAILPATRATYVKVANPDGSVTTQAVWRPVPGNVDVFLELDANGKLTAAGDAMRQHLKAHGFEYAASAAKRAWYGPRALFASLFPDCPLPVEGAAQAKATATVTKARSAKAPATVTAAPQADKAQLADVESRLARMVAEALGAIQEQLREQNAQIGLRLGELEAAQQRKRKA